MKAASYLFGLLVVITLYFAGRWWLGTPRLHGRETLERAPFAYPEAAPLACPPGTRGGPVAGSDDETTAGGTGFSVRTPANYDPTRTHPLIVVYAPSGVDRRLLERFAGLTRAATAAGFVVAYADSRPLSLVAVRELATIPDLVARGWCVDRERIHLTGHSDGGTVASAIAFRSPEGWSPAAIAPSGAGIRADDLRAEKCPAPLSVRLLHGAADRLFPGYGAEAAAWWAECNGCARSAEKSRESGCVEFPRCRAGVTTLYCEHDGGHAEWADDPAALVAFFAATLPAGSGRATR